MVKRLVSVVALVVAVCVVGAFSPPTMAQDQQEPDSKELLADFIHYILIDQSEAAAAVGQQLLDRGLSNVEFVDLVEQTQDLGRFERALPRALKKAELEPIAAAMIGAYERGKLERVRMPEEISANIAKLTGTRIGWYLARERLITAGEYAVPQLLDALLDDSDPLMQSQVQQVLRDMGRQCVIPLVTALPSLGVTGQTLVVDVLRRVPYRTSLPALHDLRSHTPSPEIRKACERAIQQIDPTGTGGTDAGDLYRQLAEGYYDERAELTSFPGERFQLLWNYDPAIGLYMTPIDIAVFHEAMAMRNAERSLELSPEDNQTLALWVSSNFSREIDTPTGYENPAYPLSRRDAMYYAVAAGSGIEQHVLLRGLDEHDTPLVRRAIAAIEKTAGGEALWGEADARQPLVEALRYPNRRVQYEAALALAAAHPSHPFTGSDRVVPILASAIRNADETYAVILAETDRYEGLRRVLQGMGYTVLPPSETLEGLAQPIADAPGIDLIVMALNTGATEEMIAQAQSRPDLSATPILALTSTTGYIDLGRKYEKDIRVSVRQSAIGGPVLTAAIEELIRVAAGGPITPEEAREYASRSLDTLRDLAVSGHPAFNVADAALPLIGALSERTGMVRLRVAEVLSWINQPRTQGALMDAALATSSDERVSLLGLTADSAKRFGNLLEDRQIARLVEIASDGSDEDATAAAALMGSLNLPNTDLIPLILSKK